MDTIVRYTNRETPCNAYPRQIVSPTQANSCCFSDMEEVGRAEPDGRWMVQYRRCRSCGFAVRVALREIPDFALLLELRRTLATSFSRNASEL
jgi:hypothetical protein